MRPNETRTARLHLCGECKGTSSETSIRHSVLGCRVGPAKLRKRHAIPYHSARPCTRSTDERFKINFAHHHLSVHNNKSFLRTLSYTSTIMATNNHHHNIQSKKNPASEQPILASAPTQKTKDTKMQNAMEEGRKDEDGSDTHPASVTEVTDADHHHHHDTYKKKGSSTPPALSSRSRCILVIAILLCSTILAGIGTALGLLLPDLLNKTGSGSNRNRTNSSSGNETTTASNSTDILFRYTSVDTPYQGSGGFYADRSHTALNDGQTDVLQRGSVVAWLKSTDPQTSTHRIIIDLEEPHLISQVNISGIVLNQWGLVAPTSLRLQLKQAAGDKSFFDGVLNVTTKPESTTSPELDWTEVFNITTKKEPMVKRALLDVTCPLGEPQVQGLTIKCGISEVEFL